MGKPLHLDGDMDNLEGELQLRNVTRAPVIAHNGRVNNWGDLYDCTTVKSATMSTNRGTSWFSEQDHGDQPLRKDRDVDDLR